MLLTLPMLYLLTRVPAALYWRDAWREDNDPGWSAYYQKLRTFQNYTTATGRSRFDN